MWSLDHPDLPLEPSSPGSTALCSMDLGESMAPLSQIDLQAQYLKPSVRRSWLPVVVVATIPPYTGSTIVLNLSAQELIRIDANGLGGSPGTPVGSGSISAQELVRVDAIRVGSKIYRRARDPNNPQPGELTWNPVTRSATLHLDMSGGDRNLPAPGLQVQILGGIESVSTNYLPGNWLEPLYGLPVTGKLTYSLTLEQSPSGSLTLFTQGDTIHAIRDRLKQGTELTLFGVGFSVSSYAEEISENRTYKIAISLSGKWDKFLYTRPVFLRGVPPKAKRTDEKYPDPSCTITTVVESPDKRLVGSTTIKELAAQAGVPFIATGESSGTIERGTTPVRSFTVAGSSRNLLGPWSIEVPADTQNDATDSWSSQVSSLTRHNGCYLDLSSPNAVYARDVHTANTWYYQVRNFKQSCQGDTQNSPDYRGYAVEYNNYRLTGRFSEQRKVRPAPRPDWIPRTPKRVTLWSGDVDAASPPPDVTLLKTLSLNWDTSGPTRTLRAVTTEDGQGSVEEEFIFGFTYLSTQILDSTGELRGNPLLYWRLVSYKKKIYLYDPIYGFALGHNVQGWRMARFKTESDEELEALTYSGSEDAVYADLYKFKQLPSVEYSRLTLSTFNSHYADVDEQTTHAAYKLCNRDGTSQLIFIPDPTWAPAVFVREETTYSCSFAQTPNPDSGFTAEDKLPPLTTGEETTVRVVKQIVPSQKTKHVFGKKDQTQEPNYDRYIEWRYEDTAQGPNFGEKALRETFEEFDGRPSPASRKPPPYEPEPPETERPMDSDDPRLFVHSLTTPGWTAEDPSGGSLSYTSETVEQGVIGAKTDLLIRDIQDSVQYSYDIPVNLDLKILDRVEIEAAGELHATRVKGIKQEITIEGMLNEYPILTAMQTSVEAGIDRIIPVELHTKKLPKPPKPPEFPGVSGAEMATSYGTRFVTRRNF